MITMKKIIFANMNSLKFLFCGGLISLFGCAGSDYTANNKVNVGADEARARAAQAYDEMEPVPSSSSQKSEAQGVASKVVLQTSSVSNVSLSEQLQSYACPNVDDLRGIGIADDAGAALLMAQKDIAAKIQSVVVAQTEQTRQSNVDAAGNETLASSFEAKTKVITRLQNAQDAKAVASLNVGGKNGVVACMQRSDAARPFVKESSLLQDSVALAIKTFEEQKHPIVKNKAFKNAREVYVRLLAVEDVLHGLGVKSEKDIKPVFDAAQQKYNDFRSRYAFYYQEENGADESAEQRRSVFERISAKYPVRAAECSEGGLLLKLNVSPAQCIEKSLGLSCTATLTLNGSSCDGESYFSVNGKVKGNGRYDKSEALERLNQNISNGDWFNDWAKELNKWRLE